MSLIPTIWILRLKFRKLTNDALEVGIEKPKPWPILTVLANIFA